MIHIERPPEPAWWRVVTRRGIEEKAREFFSRPEEHRRQERFDWISEIQTDQLNTLRRLPGLGQEQFGEFSELFTAKCVYCESIPDHGQLHLHRPREFASQLDGSVSPDHYWWLAWEWSNAFYVCLECDSAKSSYFPVGGSRAQPEATGEVLLAEQPLLLDPTLDRPEEHLVFPIEPPYELKDRTERGAVTIQVLNLNRRQLVSERSTVATAAMEAVRSLRDVEVRDEDVAKLVAELSAVSHHCALRRQVVAWAVSHFRHALRSLVKSREFARLVPLLAPYGLKQTKPTTRGFRHLPLSVVDEPPPAPGVASPSSPTPHRYLRRIRIENFKGIEELELEFSFATHTATPRAPWLMLLGENGQGKSSVLQAVALALMPAEQRRAAIEGPGRARLVRRGAEAAGARVTLELADGQAVGFTINSKGRMEGTSPPMLLCAYGSTRLLPRGKHQPPKPAGVLAHAANLFDPFLPLTDAQRWLLATEGSDRARFDYAARSIKGILDLGNERFFVPSADRKEVEVTFDDERPAVTLSELSDGYQAMLALAVDLMAHASVVQPVVGEARGLVLVDELGLHMHPRWRMRVVEGLRSAFPHLQFLVTTHDPLCLRGLYRGEVAVMRRDAEGKIVALTKDLPDVAALRVDQLLTSEYFGLQTAMDPTMEARFAEYYQLLGLHAPTPEQETRLGQLKAELADKEMLGSSERERLMYEAIDRFLARKGALKSDATRVAIPTLKEDLLAELQKIWDEA